MHFFCQEYNFSSLLSTTHNIQHLIPLHYFSESCSGFQIWFFTELRHFSKQVHAKSIRLSHAVIVFTGSTTFLSSDLHFFFPHTFFEIRFLSFRTTQPECYEGQGQLVCFFLYCCSQEAGIQWHEVTFQNYSLPMQPPVPSDPLTNRCFPFQTHS